MPHNHEWQTRIKAVEREYVAMRHAADRFGQAAFADPTILEGKLRQGEIVVASKHLEGTYIIRLFAEFETGAWQFWAANWHTDPKTVDLLTGLAARREIPDIERDNAHLVRMYRTSLVHEREEEPEEVPMAWLGSICARFLVVSPYDGDYGIQGRSLPNWAFHLTSWRKRSCAAAKPTTTGWNRNVIKEGH